MAQSVLNVDTFMHYLIYKTTNLIDNNFYIGCHKTEDPNDSYLGSGTLLNYVVKRIGADKFSRQVLYDFDNADQMYNKEAEIVNAEFIARPDTYNLIEGGQDTFLRKRKSLYIIARDDFGNFYKIHRTDPRYVSRQLSKVFATKKIKPVTQKPKSEPKPSGTHKCCRRNTPPSKNSIGVLDLILHKYQIKIKKKEVNNVRIMRTFLKQYKFGEFPYTASLPPGHIGPLKTEIERIKYKRRLLAYEKLVHPTIKKPKPIKPKMKIGSCMRWYLRYENQEQSIKISS